MPERNFFEKMNVLTFDIEEWFHLLDNASTKSENEWLSFEVRIHKNVNRILEFLQANSLKATFFVVGWIAEKYPEVVNSIHDKGYEIGSHTHLHQLMYEQSPEQVREDLKKSIDVLQQITGEKIISFRAPGFSITEQNKWVFEILIEEGIEFDSSVFPAGRAHGGMPSFKEAQPSILEINGKRIKEFPINTTSIFGQPFIFSGGGYFRLAPYQFVKAATKKSPYVMTYFHPRDFDPGQPIIQELSLSRKFKSYVGLKSCMPKLQKWVDDFEFTDLKTAQSLIYWENVTVVRI